VGSWDHPPSSLTSGRTVSCSQVFYYFQQYSKKDDRITKAIVIATLISDTVHQALISHTVYVYVISYYYTPEKLGNIVWSLIVEVFFNGITALLVQSFFAFRIWKFSGRNIFVTVALAIFVVAEFVSVVVYFAKAISMDTFAELGSLKALSMTVNVLAVAGDVLITVVFCFLLHRSRNTLQRSNTMINLLIAFAVQTGLLTSLCAIASLVSIAVSPNTFIYISFYFLLGRLYCNSLLGTLNVRKAIRGKGHGDLGISLHPIGDSSAENREIDIKSGSLGSVVRSKPHGYPDGITPPESTKDVEIHGYIKEVEVHVHKDSYPFDRTSDQEV